MSQRGTPAPEREGYAYPLYYTDERALPEDYAAPLVLCDIDNTYLISEYKNLRDLIRLRFEAAQDKQPVPGAPELIKALRRRGDGPRRGIYFVSASPETMRPVLERRLLIDEVEFDGASFRDLWTETGKPHLRHIKDIYGYKVTALLLYRRAHPSGARELLIGDNLEHDAEVYVLYSRICAGQIRGDELDGILEERGVRERDRAYILGLAEELPTVDPVQRILIRRARYREVEVAAPPFDSDDARITLFADFLQAALHLFHEDVIDADGVEGVGRAILAARPKYFDLEESLSAFSVQKKPAELSVVEDRLRVAAQQPPGAAPSQDSNDPPPSLGEAP